MALGNLHGRVPEQDGHSLHGDAFQEQFHRERIPEPVRNDPIAQPEMLRGDTAPQDGARQRMAATYPRHENAEAAN